MASPAIRGQNQAANVTATMSVAHAHEQLRLQHTLSDLTTTFEQDEG